MSGMTTLPEQFSMSKFASRQDRDDAMLAEIERLQTEVAQLRQYLDTAQRRASALGDEVAGLREALREIAQFDLWEPAGPAASRARTALAARKGEA